jgi:hypothetical protein
VDEADPNRPTPLDDLSHTLWRQRRTLDLLLYKLEVERLLLTSGNAAWLDLAAAEVAELLDVISAEEVVRATQVAVAARVLGLAPDASLRDFVEASPPPFDEIFRDHMASLMSVVGAVEELVAQNRRMLADGLQNTRTFLASIGSVDIDAPGYGRDGTLRVGAPQAAIFDSDA